VSGAAEPERDLRDRAEPVLAVRGARRAFGARVALDGVDLAVEAGSLYALLGPNGAGKSTLVGAVTGRVRLDAGTVRLGGGDPARDAAVRRRLGLVPQEIALHGELTVRENLELLGRWAGLPRRAARDAADEALGWIGLRDRAGDFAGRLSGGQQRRVNLAAGALHRPDVLLLDEPTAGVDPRAREDVHALLRDLRRRGTAILLATHDLDQAAELADRIGILCAGRVRAEGTLAELVDRTLGGASELIVTLSGDPSPDAERVLRAARLAPAASRTWAGPAGLESLEALEARLAGQGLEVREARRRAPGLAGVFFRVSGHELAD
jgi:ABC-2 type transport system ATP-binding protein